MGQGIVGVGWRRFIWVARRDAALIERPTWTSGFILIYTVKGCGC